MWRGGAISKDGIEIYCTKIINILKTYCEYDVDHKHLVELFITSSIGMKLVLGKGLSHWSELVRDTCRGRVGDILWDCGSHDPGSNPGSGP